LAELKISPAKISSAEKNKNLAGLFFSPATFSCGWLSYSGFSPTLIFKALRKTNSQKVITIRQEEYRK
jgi:hypothetical protein